MARRDDLLSAIEAIHAAGLDAAWPRALGAATRLVGGMAGTLEVFDKRSGRHRAFHGFNIPPVSEIAYLAEFATNNPRWNYLMRRQKIDEFPCDRLLIDETQMDKEPYYHDLLAPLGMRYFVLGNLVISKTEYVYFSVQRSFKQGHVQRRDIEMMARLAPHMRQAYDVAQRLGAAGDARRSLEAALECLADGVLLVGRDGAVLFANSAVRAIARRSDGIALRGGRLDLGAAEARLRLDAALASTARADDIAAADARDFPVPRAGGVPPYVMSVRPLVDHERKHVTNTQAAAIVFVHDPLGRSAAAADTLRQGLGLTEAEAALALALQAGIPLAGYAGTRGLSLNTVYTHLRRLREKTGCTRMPELIAKLDELQLALRSA
jgi:DNA-binding CsgD family transcriptional regulator/PAS domain-containing protein